MDTVIFFAMAGSFFYALLLKSMKKANPSRLPKLQPYYFVIIGFVFLIIKLIISDPIAENPETIVNEAKEPSKSAYEKSEELRIQKGQAELQNLKDDYAKNHGYNNFKDLEDKNR